jgi:thiamine-phosphate pyrophosphorylase
MKREQHILTNLYFITQDLAEKSHKQQVEEVCQGGCKLIQLRMKNSPRDTVKKEALIIHECIQPYKAVLIINDDVELAGEINADGVHLGKTDMHPAKAREILGADFIIGGTADSFERIQEIAEHVDYIGLGPYRFTTTKKNLSPLLGLEGLKKTIQQCKQHAIQKPIYAIGGIVIDDLKILMQTGIQGVAISGEIAKARNCSEATKRFIELINQR